MPRPFTISNTSAVTHLTTGNGNNTISLQQDSNVTTIVTGTGADTININADGAATAISAGGGADVINVGSNAPAGNSSIDGITQSLTLTADASATFNIDDSGNASAKTVNLNVTSITGLAPATINYGNCSTFNLNLGSGGNTVTINNLRGATNNLNTGAGNDTLYVKAYNGIANINTGGGTNTLYAGSNGRGAATELSANLNGRFRNSPVAGTDILTIDDAGDSTPRTGSLSATSLQNVGPASIGFTGVATLTAAIFGVNNDIFAVASTITGSTTINPAGGRRL